MDLQRLPKFNDAVEEAVQRVLESDEFGIFDTTEQVANELDDSTRMAIYAELQAAGYTLPTEHLLSKLPHGSTSPADIEVAFVRLALETEGARHSGLRINPRTGGGAMGPPA